MGGIKRTDWIVWLWVRRVFIVKRRLRSSPALTGTAPSGDDEPGTEILGDEIEIGFPFGGETNRPVGGGTKTP
jgi:hypothetical protein